MHGKLTALATPSIYLEMFSHSACIDSIACEDESVNNYCHCCSPNYFFLPDLPAAASSESFSVIDLIISCLAFIMGVVRYHLTQSARVGARSSANFRAIAGTISAPRSRLLLVSRDAVQTVEMTVLMSPPVRPSLSLGDGKLAAGEIDYDFTIIFILISGNINFVDEPNRIFL